MFQPKEFTPDQISLLNKMPENRIKLLTAMLAEYNKLSKKEQQVLLGFIDNMSKYNF